MTVDPHNSETLPRNRFPLLLEEARRLLSLSPACHDWDHTMRVLNNARHLCRAEHADADVVDYAAVLHDIGRPVELADRGATCHAETGAGLVAEILAGLGITDPDFVAHVAACVRTHRFRNRSDAGPATLEARIVFDADKLDSVGAIGIGRAFHFAGRIGARVHNREDEALASESYSREDSAYREFLVKLRRIREGMLTAEGRRMADGRHRFMVEFFRRLNRETAGEDF